MELLTHYKNLLEMAMLRQDDNGMIHKRGASEKITNLFVQGKPVVMPVYKQLASADISERLVFHPFAESSAKGESIIVSELRARFCANLSNHLASFFMKSIMLAASRAEHSKLNPVQSEMLDAVRKIEEKHTTSIAKLIVKILKNPDKKNISLVQIYLSRNGKVGEKDYARAGIVSFPLYTAVLAELEKTKDRAIDGQPFSEKELQYIKGLFEYMFPGLAQDASAYNRGSNSDVAPYMDALMRAAAGVQGMINEKIALFENIFNKPEGDPDAEVNLKPLPEDWMTAIDELSNLMPDIIKIPLQPGMDGQAKVSETLAAANQMAAAPPVQQAPVYQQPAYPPGVLVPTAYAPAPVQMNPYQPPPVYQQPPPGYYQQAPQGYPQPGYPQAPQQYQAPQPVYGMQPMPGANINLNPLQQNQPQYYGSAPQGKGMWD